MRVNRVKGNLTRKINLWDVLVADAEKQLKEAQTRVAGLEKAVKKFKELRDSGMPWPGTKKAGTADAIPAISQNTKTLAV